MPESIIVAGSYDFTVYRNNIRDFTCYYKVGGVGVNLTGHEAQFRIRTDHFDLSNEINLTVAGGGIEVGTDGRVTVKLSSVVTALQAIQSSSVVYSLKLTPPAAQDIPLLEGSIALSNEIL